MRRWTLTLASLWTLSAPLPALSQPSVRMLTRSGDETPTGGYTFGRLGGRALLGSGGQVLFVGRVEGESAARIWVVDPDGRIRVAAREGDRISGAQVEEQIQNLALSPLALIGADTILGGTRDTFWTVSPTMQPTVSFELRDLRCPNRPSDTIIDANHLLITHTGLVAFEAFGCGAIAVGHPPNFNVGLEVGEPVDGWPLATEPARISQVPNHNFFVNDAGDLWVAASVGCADDPDCPGGVSHGLFVRENGRLKTVIRGYTRAPHITPEDLYIAQIDIAGVAASRFAVVSVRLGTAPGVADRGTAIYLAADGILERVAMTGESLPGAPGAPVVRFDTGVNPRTHFAWVSDDGSVVIAPELMSPGNPAGARGIWRKRPGGPLELIARGGMPAPGSGGLDFTALPSPVVSPTGRIAFINKPGGPAVPEVLYLENGLGDIVAALPSRVDLEVGRSEPVQITRLSPFSLPHGTTGTDGRGMVFNARGDLLVHAEVDFTGDALFIVNNREPSREVRVIGMEVVQVSQDWMGSVPLIARKPTVVRIHVEGDDVPFRGQLRLRRGGVELPGSPLGGPEWRSSTLARPDGRNQRHRLLVSSVYFPLPPSATSGELEIEVEPHPSSAVDWVCSDKVGIEDDCKVTARFEDMPPLSVRFVEIENRHTFSNRTATRIPPPGVVSELAAELRGIYPIHQLDWTFRKLFIESRGMSHLEPYDFRESVARLRLEEDPCRFDCHNLYYGFYGAPPDDGGIAHIYGYVGVGNVHFSGWYRFTQAHELGHVAGLPHAVHSQLGLTDKGKKQGDCGEVAAADAPDWPWRYQLHGQRQATLGPIDDPQRTIYGFEARRQVVMDPREHFELMSYCDVRRFSYEPWMSGRTFVQLRDLIRERFSAPGPAPGPTAAHRVLTGARQLGRGPFELGPASVLETAAPSPGSGTLTLSLLDASGAVVYSDTLSTQELTPKPAPGSEPRSFEAFTAMVPAELEFATLRVVQGTEELARVTASANPPNIELIEPNGGEQLAGDTVLVRWSAADPDGDELSFDVSYSRDAGQSWSLIAADLFDEEIELPRAYFGGSPAALVRVRAKDGIWVSEATSAAPFSVLGQPPLVHIDQPSDGALVLASEPIHLVGGAVDAEDGRIASAALRWSSSLAGELGAGEALELEPGRLAEGDHVITLGAIDADGMEGRRELLLRVRASAPRVVFDLRPRGQLSPALVRPGAAVEVELELENQGPGEAPSAVLEILLPEALTFLEASASGGGCAETQRTVRCTLGAISPEANGTVTLRGRFEEEGDFQLHAQLEPEEGDVLHANDRTVLHAVVRADAPEPTDAGVARDAGGEGPDAGGEAGRDAGGDEGAEGSSGCGCGVASTPAGGGGPGLATLLAALLGRLAARRRR